MTTLPKISIVTPSYNQAAYLGESLQSLVDQNYPNIEVIIQEAGSNDGSIEIAQGFVEKRPSIFQLHVEKDSGQSDALNRGFRKSTGEILGFLNSDDRLRPGCLTRVAEEIDPSRNRHIVFGRSRFFGFDQPRAGLDHACKYSSHFEQLAIWKRNYNQIPQPSTFWTRQVWEQCGEIDSNVPHALDYDLFCRFSQRYRFHKVPELWSDYRLHAASKTINKTHEDLMADCETISRRYWGPWHSPLRWRCSFSCWLHKRSRRPEAILSIRKAEAALLNGKRLEVLFRGTIAAWKAPAAVAPRLLLPIAATRGWRRTALRFDPKLHFEFCPNRWIGPFCEFDLNRNPESHSLQAIIDIPERFHRQNLRISWFVDGMLAHTLFAKESGKTDLAIDLARSNSKTMTIAILCSRYFIPALDGENQDPRLLSVRLISIEQK